MPGANVELLATFMSHAAVITWIKDAQGRYLFASPAMERQMSKPGKPMAGLFDSDLLPESMVRVLRAKDLHVLETGDIHESLEDAPPVNGVRRSWFSVRFPLAGPTGPLVGGMALEITRYRQAEREKQEAQQEFRQILDAIGDMVFVKGPESRLLWANRAFRDVYGMSNEQLYGIIDAPSRPGETTEKYRKDDQQVFDTGRPLDIPDEPIRRHDGTVLRAHSVKSPIFDSAGKVVKLVCVSRDISERKTLELELRQAQKLEAVGRLASGIAHEINTPIQFVGDSNSFVRTAFGDLTELCQAYRAFVAKASAGPITEADLDAVRAAEQAADLEYATEALPRAFDAIGEGVSRVATLVRAMKEFGHPDRGERTVADLNRALRNTLTIVASEVKHVADVEIDLQDIPHVRCALGELNQVFLNLIVNAAHAITDAKRGRGTIRVSSRSAQEHVTISISDTGTGIPEAVGQKVFEPFFTTKEVGRGTGQGLAIARMVAVKHGGTLTFDTELGKGSTFHIRLPIWTDDDDDGDGEPAARPPSHS